MFGVREQMIGRAFGKAPASPAPTGMFGAGGQKKRGTARRIAGYLADFTAGLAGQQGPYGAILAREQQSADQEAQYQRQRADAYADWQKKQEWEIANKPSTTQPYRFEDNAGNVYEMGPDGQPRPIFIDPNDKQFIQDGQLITVPNVVRSRMGGQPQVLGSTLPQGWSIEGGPGGTPSGAGFPHRQP